jgi:hypothetical protein
VQHSACFCHRQLNPRCAARECGLTIAGSCRSGAKRSPGVPRAAHPPLPRVACAVEEGPRRAGRSVHKAPAIARSRVSRVPCTTCLLTAWTSVTPQLTVRPSGRYTCRRSAKLQHSDRAAPVVARGGWSGGRPAPRDCSGGPAVLVRSRARIRPDPSVCGLGGLGATAFVLAPARAGLSQWRQLNRRLSRPRRRKRVSRFESPAADLPTQSGGSAHPGSVRRRAAAGASGLMHQRRARRRQAARRCSLHTRKL